MWASQWSPAGIDENQRSFMTEAAMIGSGTNYTAPATILTNFVTLMTSSGVPIYALSPQNEPDVQTWYPSATWTPLQVREFVPYLHGAFQAVGVMDTKIMIAEQSTWGPRLQLCRDSFSYAS